METFLLNQVLRPLTRRAGSFVAGLFVSAGFSVELVQQLELAFAALAAVLLDLVLSYYERRRA